jgi:NADH-quinone oxidoreductase subunit H
MITTSAVCVALFFGGWHLPWIEWAWPALRGNVDLQHPEITTSLLACIVRALVFFAKTLFFIFVFMWVRWSLPRFRFDQLMMVAWRGLIPISLGLLMMTSVAVYWFHGDNVGGAMALTLLIANIIAAALIMGISRIIPPAPQTNRRLRVLGSRFSKTPLPAT